MSSDGARARAALPHVERRLEPSPRACLESHVLERMTKTTNARARLAPPRRVSITGACCQVEWRTRCGRREFVWLSPLVSSASARCRRRRSRIARVATVTSTVGMASGAAATSDEKKLVGEKKPIAARKRAAKSGAVRKRVENGGAGTTNDKRAGSAGSAGSEARQFEAVGAAKSLAAARRRDGRRPRAVAGSSAPRATHGTPSSAITCSTPRRRACASSPSWISEFASPASEVPRSRAPRGTTTLERARDPTALDRQNPKPVCSWIAAPPTTCESFAGTDPTARVLGVTVTEAGMSSSRK